MTPTNHTELLNWLISKQNLKSYLEIGVQNPGNNFDKIKCDVKGGVDPEVSGFKNIIPVTSDIFFESEPNLKWDLIFIDGLHHSDQVKKDFDNSLRCLTDNGFIVIHDTLPENEEGTLVPRIAKRWWGDVYKFIFKLNTITGMDFVTINMDEGCTLVWKDTSKTGMDNWPPAIGADWQTYLNNKKESHRIIEPSDYFK